MSTAKDSGGIGVQTSDRLGLAIARWSSTIRNESGSIVMNDRAIIEKVNCEELLTCDWHYTDPYNTYFHHQSPENIEIKTRRLELGEVAAD